MMSRRAAQQQQGTPLSGGGSSNSSGQQQHYDSLPAPPPSASAQPPAGAGDDCWRPYWHLQELRWHHYDLNSMLCCLMLSSFNVWRSTLAASSYSTPRYVRLLRFDQGMFVAHLLWNGWTCWLLLRRAATYQCCRRLLVFGRWLLLAGIVATSTPLPVFQSMHVPGSSSGGLAAWPSRWLELLFHSGAMYNTTGFLFHRLPWQHSAVAGSIFTVLACAVLLPVYCSNVVAAGEQHADAPLLAGVASTLDLVAFQPGASASVAGMGTAVQQQQQQHRECMAPAMMVHAVTLLASIAITFVLERLSKWAFLQQHRHHHQASSSSGSSGGGSTGPGGDWWDAPSAWALVRGQTLWLLLLADLPLLLLWWGLSTWVAAGNSNL